MWVHARGARRFSPERWLTIDSIDSLCLVEVVGGYHHRDALLLSSSPTSFRGSDMWFAQVKKRRTYLRDQDLVTRLHARCYALALLVERAGSNGQDLGFVELLDRRVGQEDARRSLRLGLDALHKDTVEERSNAADGLDGGLGELVSRRM